MSLPSPPSRCKAIGNGPSGAPGKNSQYMATDALLCRGGDEDHLDQITCGDVGNDNVELIDTDEGGCEAGIRQAGADAETVESSRVAVEADFENGAAISCSADRRGAVEISIAALDSLPSLPLNLYKTVSAPDGVIW